MSVDSIASLKKKKERKKDSTSSLTEVFVRFNIYLLLLFYLLYISIYKNECLSVCLFVCLFFIRFHTLRPNAAKLSRNYTLIQEKVMGYFFPEKNRSFLPEMPNYSSDQSDCSIQPTRRNTSERFLCVQKTFQMGSRGW